MSTIDKPKMGRPRGQEFPNLLHVRISDDMKQELERIQDARLDHPNITALVREALALLIRRERQKERT